MRSSIDKPVTKICRTLALSMVMVSACMTAAQAAANNRNAGNASREPELSTAVYGDWVVQCRSVQVDALPPRLCEVTQTLKTTLQGADNSPTQTVNVAQLALGRVRDTEPFGLTVAVPIDVTLPGKITLSFENDLQQPSFSLNWSRCLPSGCYATLVLTEANVSMLLKAPGSAKLLWQVASSQTVQIPVSFRGFAQAFEQLLRK